MLRLTLVAVLAVAVCAEPRWRNFFLHEDLVMGMSFDNMKEGWAVRMRSGSGPEAGAAVLKTVDGGQTWAKGRFASPPPMSILMPFDISVRSDGTGVMVGTGLLMVPGRLYTTDGMGFNNSLAMGMDNSRSVKRFGTNPKHYAAVGVFSFSENGVAISRDGGVTWEQIQWPRLPIMLAPNSAEYVTEKLWYVGAGSFPQRDDDDDDELAASRGKAPTGPFELGRGWTLSHDLKVHAPTAKPLQNNEHDYYTMIRKTEDGGATWIDLFEEWGGFSYESISCPSATLCYAAGASSVLGGRLLRTEDGGDSWDIVVEYDTTSLSTVQFFDRDNGWVTGGWPNENRGYAARTFDGGKTWQEYKLTTYPLYAKFLDMNNGWASGPNFAGGGMDLAQFMDWTNEQ